MFHKWESMSFNFKKTYIYILYLIYMSLNFLMHILMSRTMRQYVAYNPPITSHSTRFPSLPRVPAQNFSNFEPIHVTLCVCSFPMALLY